MIRRRKSENPCADFDSPQPIDGMIDDKLEPPQRRPVVGSGRGGGFIDDKPTMEAGSGVPPSNVNTGDAELLPLVAIAPDYPDRALQRGIEGWCLAGSTIDGRGNVVEDGIVVVDAEPPDIFDHSSIRAAPRRGEVQIPAENRQRPRRRNAGEAVPFPLRLGWLTAILIARASAQPV